MNYENQPIQSQTLGDATGLLHAQQETNPAEAAGGNLQRGSNQSQGRNQGRYQTLQAVDGMPGPTQGRNAGYLANFNSLKARMQKSTNTSNTFGLGGAMGDGGSQGAGLGSGLDASTSNQNKLTRQELRDLKSMNRNREIYQMMGRTQQNTHEYIVSALRPGQTGAGRRPSSKRLRSASSSGSRMSNQSSSQTLRHKRRNLQSAASRGTGTGTANQSLNSYKFNNKLQNNCDKIMGVRQKRKKYAGTSSLQKLMKVTAKFDALSGASAGGVQQGIERSFSSGEALGVDTFTPSRGGITAVNSETDNLRMSFQEAQKVSGTKGQLSEAPETSDRASSYNQQAFIMRNRGGTTGNLGGLAGKSQRQRIQSAQQHAGQTIKQRMMQTQQFPDLGPKGQLMTQNEGGMNQSQKLHHQPAHAQKRIKTAQRSKGNGLATAADIDNEAALIMQRYKGMEGNLYSRGQAGRIPLSNQEIQPEIQDGNKMQQNAAIVSNLGNLPATATGLSLQQEATRGGTTQDSMAARRIAQQNILNRGGTGEQVSNLQMQQASALTKTNNLDLSGITSGLNDATHLPQRVPINFHQAPAGQATDLSLINKNSSLTNVPLKGPTGQFGPQVVARTDHVVDIRQYAHTQNPKSPDQEGLENADANHSSYEDLGAALQGQNLQANKASFPQESIGDHLGSNFTPLLGQSKVEKVSEILLRPSALTEFRGESVPFVSNETDIMAGRALVQPEDLSAVTHFRTQQNFGGTEQKQQDEWALKQQLHAQFQSQPQSAAVKGNSKNPRQFRVKSGISRKSAKTLNSGANQSVSKVSNATKIRQQANQTNATAAPSGNYHHGPTSQKEAIYAGDQTWQRARAGGGSPSKAPQFQIEQIKKDIKDRLKENESLRDKICAADMFNKKLTEGMKEFKSKVAQCQADKVEIMRDLATYEVNYARDTRNSAGQVLRDRLSGLIGCVKDARARCQQYIKFHDDGEAYFTDSSYSLNTNEDADSLEGDAGQHLGQDAYRNRQLSKAKQPNTETAFVSQKEVDYILKQMLILQKTKQNRHTQQKFNENPQTKAAAPGAQRSPQESSLGNGTHGAHQDIGLTIIEERSPAQTPQSRRSGVQNNGSGFRASPVPQDPSSRQAAAANSAPGSQGRDSTKQRMAAPPTNKSYLHSIDSEEESLGNRQRQPGSEYASGKKKGKKRKENALGISQERNDESLDKYYGRRVLSGINCIVSAQYVHGFIKGQISCEVSSKNFKLDLRPNLSQRFQGVTIKTELDRIYLTVLADAASKKDRLQIKVKDKLEMRVADPREEGEFIIQLEGSMHRINCISLEVDHEAGVVLASTRINPQGAKKSALGKPEAIEIQKPLKLAELPDSCFALGPNPSISLQEVARYVESTMTIHQRPNGQHELVAKDWLSSVFKDAKASWQTAYKAAAGKGGAKPTKSAKSPTGPDGDASFYTGDAKIKIQDQSQAPVGSCRPGDGNKQFTQSFEIAPKDQNTNEGPTVQMTGPGYPEEMQTPFLDKIIVPSYAADGGWGPPSKQIVLLSEAQRRQHAEAAAEAALKQAKAIAKSARQLDLTFGLPLRKRCRSALREGANEEKQTGSVKEAGQAGPKRSRTCPAMPQVSISPQETDGADVKEPSQQVDSKMEGKSVIYIEDAQFQHLQRLRQKEHADSLAAIAQEEAELDQFDAAYALRMTKAQKRYTINQNQRQKHAEFVKQRDQDQVKLIGTLLDSFDSEVKAKTRQADLQQKQQQNAQKRIKYRRQPKIYQNDYIAGLQRGPCEIRQRTDPEDPEQRILFLFFAVRNQVYVLLGREDNDAGESDSQDEDAAESEIDGMSKTSSQLANQMKERDDDSPYFVRIPLDQQFLADLREASIGEPSDILGRCDIVVENAGFNRLVRDELDQMFGPKVEKAESPRPGQKAGESGAPAAPETGQELLKRLHQTKTALESVNMLKIAEHINEDSSEHRSFDKGGLLNLESAEQAGKDGDQNAASPPRSRQSDAEAGGPGSRLKSRDSQRQLQSAQNLKLLPLKVKDLQEGDGKLDTGHEALSMADPTLHANQLNDSEQTAPLNTGQRARDRLTTGAEDYKAERAGLGQGTAALPGAGLLQRSSAPQSASAFEASFDELLGNFSIVMNFNS